MSYLSDVLTPFFVAWLLAYLLFPMVKFFQYRCHLRFRIVGILCTFLVVGLVLWGGFMLIVPPFIAEGVKVKDLVVAYAENDTMLSSIPSTLQQFIHDHLGEEQLKAITQEGFITEMKSLAPRLWAFVTQSIGMVWGLFSLTMILLYTLFILIDYEAISEGWLRFLPLRWRKFAQQLVSGMGRWRSQRGQYSG